MPSELDEVLGALNTATSTIRTVRNINILIKRPNVMKALKKGGSVSATLAGYVGSTMESSASKSEAMDSMLGDVNLVAEVLVEAFTIARAGLKGKKNTEKLKKSETTLDKLERSGKIVSIGGKLTRILLTETVPGAREVATPVIAGISQLSALGSLMLGEFTEGDPIMPKAPKPTCKQVREQQQATTEKNLHDFRQKAEKLPAPQAQWFNKMVLGIRNPKKHYGPTYHLRNLRNIGVGLHELSNESKKELVQAFERGLHKHHTASNTGKFITQRSGLFDKTTVHAETFLELFCQHTHPYGVSGKMVNLLTDLKFPKNIGQQMLVEMDPQLIAICDPEKLNAEEQRIRRQLESKGEILTREELVRFGLIDFDIQTRLDAINVGQLRLADMPKAKEAHERAKILSMIKIEDVISEDIYRLSGDLQVAKQKAAERRMSPNSSEETPAEIENKLLYIMNFLNTSNYQKELPLAKFIDPELARVSSACQAELGTQHEASLQVLLDQYSDPPNTLSRRESIAFYKHYLEGPSKIEALADQFGDWVAGKTEEFNLPLAKIAVLLGQLDPKRDEKEIKAYEELLIAMLNGLRVVILETENNEELIQLYESVGGFLNGMIITSFARRGERLETKYNILSDVAEWVGTTGKMLNYISTISLLFTPELAIPAAAIGAGLTTGSTMLSEMISKQDPKQITSMPKLTSYKVQVTQKYEEIKNILNQSIAVYRESKEVLQAHSKVLQLQCTDPESLEPRVYNDLKSELRIIKESIRLIDSALDISLLKQTQLAEMKLEIAKEDKPVDAQFKIQEFESQIEQCSQFRSGELHHIEMTLNKNCIEIERIKQSPEFGEDRLGWSPDMI